MEAYSADALRDHLIAQAATVLTAKEARATAGFFSSSATAKAYALDQRLRDALDATARRVLAAVDARFGKAIAPYAGPK